MDLSIVIPLYNEAENIRPLIGKLSTMVEKCECTAEVILINDGSTDATRPELEEAIKPHPSFKAFHLRRNRGKSAAYTLGFKNATGRLIATMDGDLQDDPGDILKMMRAMTEPVDFIVGWKSEGKNGPMKSLYSKLFNFVVILLSGLRVHDINCPLRLFRRECITDLKLKGDFFRYIPLLVAWKGYKVTEVPVSNHERIHGRSKFSINRYFEAVIDLLTLLFLHRYSEKPMHFFSAVGLGVFTAGFGIDLFLTIRGLFFTGIIGHFALLLLGVFLMLLGVQIMIFGFIAALMVLRREPEL